MENNIIEITGLTKKYDSVPVVDNLNLNIKKGEIFGLLGPNGAGKSTAIRMMLGLTEPTSGTIKICGESSIHNPIKVKKQVGYLPEDVGFYNNLTGFENLMFTARLNQIPETEANTRVKQLMNITYLSAEANKKTGAYSKGMKQRLGLADVLIKKPKVIILDEPTIGLDPKGVKEFLNQITGLSKKEGITVLFSSHHLHQVQQVCDRIGLFVKGKLIAVGNIQSLSEKLFSESPVVIEAGIQYPNNNTKKANSESSKLTEIIKKLKGVTNVIPKDNNSFIECKKDLTPIIAKTIVENGFELVSLNKKEYGLDDIYYKYFEGGNTYEK
ncbi:MAG: ABC transporter ATP-binding protein [Bacteroidales bacterium]|nr:ABC transporter ATP-binding protein [Bacteroidales bacterium]